MYVGLDGASNRVDFGANRAERAVGNPNRDNEHKSDDDASE